MCLCVCMHTGCVFMLGIDGIYGEALNRKRIISVLTCLASCLLTEVVSLGPSNGTGPSAGSADDAGSHGSLALSQIVIMHMCWRVSTGSNLMVCIDEEDLKEILNLFLILKRFSPNVLDSIYYAHMTITMLYFFMLLNHRSLVQNCSVRSMTLCIFVTLTIFFSNPTYPIRQNI